MRLRAVIAAFLVLLGGCGGEDRKTPQSARAATPTASPTANPTAPIVTPEPAPTVSAASVKRAAKLPLEEAVAQLMVVAVAGTDLTDPVFTELREHGWGGIAPAPEVAPILAPEATLIAQQAGKPVPFVVGVTMSLGPDADVPIADGLEPPTIARRIRRLAKRWRATGVVPAIGHFPGQGAASQDPLEGPAIVGLSRDELQRRDLVPFEAISGVAPVIVVSSAAYAAFDPVTPAAIMPEVVRDLLRFQLRFRGVVMTDELTGLAIATGGSVEDVAVDAVRAGVDLVHVDAPEDRVPVYNALLAAVRSKRISAARLREAVARVLALKARAAPPAPAPA